MFDYNKDPNTGALETAITKLFSEMEKLDGDSEEYTKTAENLVKLIKLKNEAIKLDNESNKIVNDHAIDNAKLNNEAHKLDFDMAVDEKNIRIEEEKLRSWKPSSDALVGAAASVLGIVLVLNYEKLGVVTSKAFTFIGKMK